jgi:hypothetical protein
MNPRHPLPPDDDALRDPASARLAARARAELDASVLALDAATLSRLNRARQRALDAARVPHRAAWRWTALATAACALVAALALWRLPPPALEAPLAMPAAADMALIGDGSDLALVEDLEFYAWLDAQSADG